MASSQPSSPSQVTPNLPMFDDEEVAAGGWGTGRKKATMAGKTSVEYMVVEEKYSYLPRFDTCYGPAHMIGHVVFGLDKDKFRARMKKYGLLLLVFTTISFGAMFLAMAGKLPPWALLPSAFGIMVLPSLMLLYANIHLARLIVFSSIEFWFLQALFALFIVSACDMFKWDLRWVGGEACRGPAGAKRPKRHTLRGGGGATLTLSTRCTGASACSRAGSSRRSSC